MLPEPSGAVTTLTTRVRPLDVDPLRHMNNAAYVDMVDDGLNHLPADERLEAPNCYRLGYVMAALPGTPIQIDCWRASERQSPVASAPPMAPSSRGRWSAGRATSTDETVEVVHQRLPEGRGGRPASCRTHFAVTATLRGWLRCP